jgi:RNA polymerase sigma-70 factor (ECF subfamily)
MGTDDQERRFRTLFESEARGVLGYALRRVESAEDAADIVAETFSVAWRRIEEVPAESEARLWLYGVARRVLANQRRGALRRQRLGDRLRERLRLTTGLVAVADDDRADAVRQAIAQLPEQDREVLLLANWECLTPTEIAGVIGVPAPTVRTRLHRARRRLRAELETSADMAINVVHARAEIQEAR